MRISLITLSAASALALTACGSETSGEFATEEGQTGEYVIDEDSGNASMSVETEDGTVTMRTGTDTPDTLPAGFTLVSDAEVLSNTIVDQGETKGSLTTFRSDMTPEAIVAHYRSEAENAGIAIQIETAMNGGMMIGGENEATGTTFSVSVFPVEESEGDEAPDDEASDEGASDTGGGVQGQLTISEEPG